MTLSPSEIEELLAEARFGELTADTHHARDFAGRKHGFIRCDGELVPVGAIVLGVEGMPEDQGRARLALFVAAVNALPTHIAERKEWAIERGALLADRKALLEAVEPFAELAADYEAYDAGHPDDALLCGRRWLNRDEPEPPKIVFADFRRARAARDGVSR